SAAAHRGPRRSLARFRVGWRGGGGRLPFGVLQSANGHFETRRPDGGRKIEKALEFDILLRVCLAVEPKRLVAGPAHDCRVGFAPCRRGPPLVDKDWLPRWTPRHSDIGHSGPETLAETEVHVVRVDT